MINCTVDVERISTPRVKSLTNRTVTCKRKSEDLFCDSPTEVTNKLSGKENELPCKIKKKTDKKKVDTNQENQSERLIDKKIRDSDTTSIKGKEPLASSSPVVSPPFKGFNTNTDLECEIKPKEHNNKSKGMLQTNEEEAKLVTRNTVAVIDSECKNETMEVAAEVKCERKTSSSRVKKGAKGKANETFVVEESDIETPVFESDDCERPTSQRTKDIVKSSKDIDERMKQVQPKVEDDDEIPPNHKRTRSKALRMKTDSQSSEDETVPRSRTKVIRKGVEPVVVSEIAAELKDPPLSKALRKTDSQSSEDDIVQRSRTKVIKKGVEPVVFSETAAELMEPLSTKRFVDSPASLKG